MAKVYITDTILRDAHQSQAATRMRTEDMLPVAEKLTRSVTGRWKCGRRDVRFSLRFLREDPWERLRKLRAAMPTTLCRCCFAGRICPATGITPTMSWICSSKSR